jgi:GTPase SAR1 family protein
VLLVYDICDRESFDWLVKWRDQVVEYTGDMSSVVLAVVGNKCDRNEERQVTEDEGREAAQKLGVHLFFETSAKSGINIDELFHAVAKAAMSKVPASRSGLADDDKIKLQRNAPAKPALENCCGGGPQGQQGSAI